MDGKSARQFLDLLGHRGALAQIERIEHPTKRLHRLWRASHPSIGHADDADKGRAWDLLMTMAEAQGPLPDICEATTRSGAPCKNAPEKGGRLCGAHASVGAGSASKIAASIPDGATPGRCAAKTKKGRPCQNGPQRGERFCGPHLEQSRRKPG